MRKLIYFDAEWQESDSSDIIAVTDPSTGDVIDNVSDSVESDMKKVIDSASQAFITWSKESAYYRAEYLEKLYELVLQEKEVLAEILTKENGKPYLESLGEIIYGANFIKWYAEEGKRVYGQFIPSSSKDKRIMVRKEPVGVVYGITPWNFPFAMITRKLAPALAAGCTFIIKPAEETPLTAIKMFELIDQVGFPKGVVNLITGEPKRLTKVVMEDQRVRKVTFTGSTAVGKLLMTQASATMKNISLELGGHAPLIVFEDADIEKAVEGTIASKFRNCGQVCIATNRVLVHQTVKSAYILALKAKVETLKVGNGFEDQVKLGPIINKAGYLKVINHVRDAVKKGAEIISGETEIQNKKNVYFMKPLILDNVSRKMDIYYEETFGPVIPIITFETDEEAIELANDTNYGLAAYFFTESIAKGFYVSESLEYGIIGLNTGSPSSAQAPFGGYKESGIGREGGHFGLEEYLETKYICLGL